MNVVISDSLTTLISDVYVGKIPLYSLLPVCSTKISTLTSLITLNRLRGNKITNLRDFTTIPDLSDKLSQDTQEEEMIVTQLYSVVLLGGVDIVVELSLYSVIGVMRRCNLPYKQLIERIILQPVVDPLITSIVLDDKDYILKSIDVSRSNKIRAYRLLSNNSYKNTEITRSKILLRYFLFREVFMLKDLCQVIIQWNIF